MQLARSLASLLAHQWQLLHWHCTISNYSQLPLHCHCTKNTTSILHSDSKTHKWPFVFCCLPALSSAFRPCSLLLQYFKCGDRNKELMREVVTHFGWGWNDTSHISDVDRQAAWKGLRSTFHENIHWVSALCCRCNNIETFGLNQRHFFPSTQRQTNAEYACCAC